METLQLLSVVYGIPMVAGSLAFLTTIWHYTIARWIIGFLIAYATLICTVEFAVLAYSALTDRYIKWRCNIKHEWNGCVCRRCGKNRNENHEWNGCKCNLCRIVRNEGHRWNKSHCLCETCHKENHHVVHCKCDKCGEMVHSAIRTCVCSICGQEFHNWGYHTSQEWTPYDNAGMGGYTPVSYISCSKCGQTQ